MNGVDTGPLTLAFHALTPDRWEDLETLFGPRGACGGCWCMYWRLTRSEFERHKGMGNRSALQALVEAGDVPGILAYDGAAPIGWCAVAPRAEFGSLNRSRILKPVDHLPVWSIVCFVVHKDYRRKGVSIQLLGAAKRHATQRGASILEGYPVDPRGGRTPDVFAWTGTVSAFLAAGFYECARRSAGRPIMRYDLQASEWP